ncbi:MAG: thiamine pyrophosphate-binding protein, partial [bacterium]|nr:thiamine pyrophosphate-binding protein [bacterium]
MQNPAQQPTEFPSSEQREYEEYDDRPEPRSEPTIVAAFVDHLAELGVEQSFGVSGGAIALLFDALTDSPIALHHFRHETGAAFAAVEAYFASDKPTLVFATTGPGTLNALNGLMAAKWDGAKVILISGATNAGQRGRWATQETSSYTLPQDVLYTQGALFDFAVRMEQASEFPEVIRRLSLGLSRPGGFVAHVCLPIGVQSARVDLSRRRSRATVAAPTANPSDVESCAELLKGGPFAVWVGFGARKAAPAVRALVERTGAKAFCSPRAKGVVSENHPQFLGVTGLGGHDTVTDYMVQQRPDWVLVLGTRLGEATS